MGLEICGNVRVGNNIISAETFRKYTNTRETRNKTVSKYQGVKTKKSFVSPVNFSRVEIKVTSESLDLVNYLFLLMINF